MEQTYDFRESMRRKKYNNFSLGKNLLGGLKGSREIFSNLRYGQPWKQVVFIYVFLFLVNYGLALLFLYLFFPATGIFISKLWYFLLFFLFFQIVYWLLCMLIYHALCKVAKGKAGLRSALAASAFIYPFLTLMLSALVLLALFVKLQWYLAVYLPFLLLIILLIWRMIAVVKGASAMYEISKGKTFVMFAIAALIACGLLYLAYIALSLYTMKIVEGIAGVKSVV